MVIGNIRLKYNIFFAPMAGLTDLPMRLIAKEEGAGLVYTEMISAKALVCGSKKTRKLLTILYKERPVAVQIFGSDAATMSEAAKIIEGAGADILDINLGCPVKKIAKAGAGAKLLTNKLLLSKILETIVKSIKIPVTIKIRTGLVYGQNIAAEIINTAHNCGVKMVAVHARPAIQMHSGSPDLCAFAQACSIAGKKIPIIGNGGIVDEETALSFLKIPNCTGIMVGRGAIGNYSIFKRLEKFFKTGIKSPPPSQKEKLKWLQQHVLYAVDLYGEKRGLILMRKVIPYYIRDVANAAKIRSRVNNITVIKDFIDLIRTIT
ncbi:MAG: tRNA dihydrouridine synthase DusB [Endomicrobium sp.]|jgi:tRNA-dihydrouridine synthase B|nr:tRNA dihydrouridine synthase DusB [Endomicrobium sp.]